MTRKTISLNDAGWRMGSVLQKPFGNVNDLAEVKEWLPAQVPGDVRLDLLRAGKISDPLAAMNNEESQWVDRFDWWYVRDLKLELAKHERAFLIFDGIDYQSAVFWKGEQLGRHVGMFSRQIYEIHSPVVSNPSSDKPQLAIRVWGSGALPKLKLSLKQKIWKHLVMPLFSSPNEPFPERYATLKCQMQFGWDFAPRLLTCGIWDEALITLVRSVFIENVGVKVKANSALTVSGRERGNLNAAKIEIILSLDSDNEQIVRVDCNVRGKKFLSDTQAFNFDVPLSRGKNECKLELDLQNAREWNPWDRGEPNLYELELLVSSKSGDSYDSTATSFGIRSFELRREGAQHDPWTFILNGNREFVRGANWVPLDAIPGRLGREAYADRLRQVQDANINFLRVWGGGLREKQAFYDLCDELGILVWQEFPFAGAILDRFPHDGAFLDFVRGESRAIVRTLYNHPSVVVWCGGNEFNTRGNSAIVETLRGVVTSEDGTRPFKPASPHRDESHNWRVWHRSANLRDYKKDRTPFLSEFGLQSAPNAESLQNFLPPDSLFPPNAMWRYHHAELKKLERYAGPNPTLTLPHLHRTASVAVQMRGGEGRGLGLSGYVSATQRVQAIALQTAIEHMRRRKSENAAGVAVWQFNDCWPAISWSVIDYYGVPKQAYYAVKRAYSPVLASFEYELEPRRNVTRVQGDLWIVNDLCSSFADARVVALLNEQEIFSRGVNIASDSAKRVDTLSVPLREGENILRLKLEQGSNRLSENEYDLNFCDEGEINPLVAMYVAIGNRLMR